YRELLEYLRGDRTRLEWALDLRLARSDFHRAVLRATAAIPYGAVTSYAGIAAEIGKPAATRAVAQALRWNPLPIVVPCHRIIGASGALTGYSGNKIELKRDLLAVEGIRAVGARDGHVARQALYHYERNEQREYCLPTCGDIARRPIGRVTLMASRDLAESLGLGACTRCRPELHPLAASRPARRLAPRSPFHAGASAVSEKAEEADMVGWHEGVALGAALAFPIALMTAALLFVERRARIRLAECARQVAVTDAIHADLGAIV